MGSGHRPKLLGEGNNPHCYREVAISDAACAWAHAFVAVYSEGRAHAQNSGLADLALIDYSLRVRCYRIMNEDIEIIFGAKVCTDVAFYHKIRPVATLDGFSNVPVGGV